MKGSIRVVQGGTGDLGSYFVDSGSEIRSVGRKGGGRRPARVGTPFLIFFPGGGGGMLEVPVRVRGVGLGVEVAEVPVRVPGGAPVPIRTEP